MIPHYLMGRTKDGGFVSYELNGEHRNPQAPVSLLATSPSRCWLPPLGSRILCLCVSCLDTSAPLCA
jgi:hypothetical protein